DTNPFPDVAIRQEKGTKMNPRSENSAAVQRRGEKTDLPPPPGELHLWSIPIVFGAGPSSVRNDRPSSRPAAPRSAASLAPRGPACRPCRPRLDSSETTAGGAAPSARRAADHF